MRRRWLAGFLARWSALVLLLAAAPSAADPGLLWPLDTKPALSSTFGETRSTAFHAGIDLKTWGKTGLPVRAIADGWVLRARTSPWGYGRALYLRLADGRIAVFAHLQGFAEPVAARIRRAQQAARRYSVQLWFDEGEIPVRRGEVIAFTGQSGAGPPHLHVEVRDADNVPMNPLLEGLGPVKDTTPPTLRRLVLLPLEPGATVDGGHEPVVVPLRWQRGRQRYAAGRPVSIWGRVGVAIDDHDRADLADNRLAALRHVLTVDGDTVSVTRYRRVSYADGHQVLLDRLRPTADGGAFAALFRRPGNRLSFYDVPGGGDGALVGGGQGLAPGRHELRVEAADAAGNRAEARLELRVAADPSISGARLVAGVGGERFLQADVDDADDARLTVRIDALRGEDGDPVHRGELAVGAGPYTWPLPARPVDAWRLTVVDAGGRSRSQSLAVPAAGATTPFELTLQATARPRHAVVTIAAPRRLRRAPEVTAAGRVLPVHEVAPRRWRAVVPLHGRAADSVVVEVAGLDAAGARGRGRLRLAARALRPGQADTVRWFGGAVALAAAPGSAYEELYPQAEPLTPVASNGLRATPVGFELGPADAAFDERARVILRAPSVEPGLGVYADDGKGRWVWLGADAAGPGALSAAVRALGRFALMVDDTPPAITRVRPRTGAETGAEPLISAGVADAGSGIAAEEDVVLALDGTRLISVYDPEADRVTARPDAPLAPGPHELVVTVRDAAGNEAQERRTFRVR